MGPNKDRLSVGIALMLTSALLTCTGQLCWKLSALREPPLLFLLAGFGLYGLGALLMMAAMRFGELSVLHPMLGAGYVRRCSWGPWCWRRPSPPTSSWGSPPSPPGWYV